MCTAGRIALRLVTLAMVVATSTATITASDTTVGSAGIE